MSLLLILWEVQFPCHTHDCRNTAHTLEKCENMITKPPVALLLSTQLSFRRSFHSRSFRKSDVSIGDWPARNACAAHPINYIDAVAAWRTSEQTSSSDDFDAYKKCCEVFGDFTANAYNAHSRLTYL